MSRYFLIALALLSWPFMTVHASNNNNNASDTIITLQSLYSGKALDQVLQYYEDSSGSLTDDQLSSVPWQEHTGQHMAFGYTDSVYWFRLRIRNDSDSAADRLISIAYPVLDHVRVLSRAAEGDWSVEELGISLHFMNARCATGCL